VREVLALGNTSPLDVMTRINQFYQDFIDENVLNNKKLPSKVKEIIEQNRKVLQIFESEGDIISSLITTGKTYEIIDESGKTVTGLATRTSREKFEQMMPAEDFAVKALDNKQIRQVFKRSKNIFEGKLKNF